ncbi:MAG: transcription elongation factor GreB [Bdellovibrionales bacterium]|nr:transcription elongation factor GreB [Bdellovibrionales bacterium]
MNQVTKNYITPGGFRALQAELKQLRTKERPKLTETIAWAAGNGDRSENGDYIYGKKRLREIDKRIRFLLKRIENAEVIDPAQQKGTEVRFGATVTILDEDGNEKTYSIVGTDEMNIEKGKISYVSPLASALLRRKEGDVITFRSPRGEQEIEILEVAYRDLG